ncbi:MAG: archaellin/type IV pilin N-terminal domain-containing protein [Candidatus Bathyarchaeia archaeon]
MKILKSKKALSPVVASIILIAVTVAVSIAVAAWMGALTFSFMGTEQLTVQKIRWGTGNANFNLTVTNTGTKDATINQVLVNYAGVTATIAPTLPYILKTTKSVSLIVTYTYSNGTNYDISVVTSDNYKFTNTFQGGAPSG